MRGWLKSTIGGRGRGGRKTCEFVIRKKPREDGCRDSGQEERSRLPDGSETDETAVAEVSRQETRAQRLPRSQARPNVANPIKDVHEEEHGIASLGE